MPGESTTTAAIAPYLCCRDAGKAMQFYMNVFGAAVREEVIQPDGRVGHAELVIGNAVIMVADEFPEIGFVRPGPGGTSVMMTCG